MPPSRITAAHRAYWQANLRLVAFCLAIWFICSYGCGVIFVDELNTVRIGGFKLGFWFAQQGSIYIFVGLIFFYAWRMNRLDHKFDVDEV
jgi:putative solute:sodium symporter small subunit